MEKGFNTTVESTRKEIAEFISAKLKVLPISVMNLILESILMDVNSILKKTIEQEEERYTKELNVQKEQIEWAPKEETE